MAGIKFTNHSYKIQAKKRMEENSGAGMVLRKIVMIENILVMNEAQFRHFYKQFSGREILGGDYEDINGYKLNIVKDLMEDLSSNIQGGVYIGQEDQKVQIS